MSKYLVTGGAGFIGSNIVEELVKLGENVVVLDNLSTGYKKNIEPFLKDIRLIEGDIREIGTVKEAMQGVDYVLHQAALASVPRSIDDPILVNDVNVRHAECFGGSKDSRCKMYGLRGFFIRVW